MGIERSPKPPKRRQFAALSGYRDWQLHDAKAHLSDLVRRAREEGPQRITVYGEDAVVVVAAAEYRADADRVQADAQPACAARPNSPLRDLEFGEEGERSPVRDVGLRGAGCSTPTSSRSCASRAAIRRSEPGQRPRLRSCCTSAASRLPRSASASSSRRARAFATGSRPGSTPSCGPGSRDAYLRWTRR